MSGVLFIICIPREEYEKCLANKLENVHVEELKIRSKSGSNLGKKLQQQESLSSDESSSTTKENDTYAVSIESDSLNARDEGAKCSTQRKMSRIRSYDEILDAKDDGKRRENIGSLDSEDFDRSMKKLAQKRENEEAVEKFFSHVNAEKPPLDKSATMERVLLEIIDRMRIRNASWHRVNGGNSYKISFSLEKGFRCDDTIHMLSEFGIGQKEGSSIAIVPCTLYNDKTRLKEDDESSTSTQAMFKETSWNRFIGTVRARMNVAKIVEAVRSDAALSFDFVILLIVASVLASFGLVENNTLFLAASMLISPLMGPILASTFGSVIKDKKLQFWGLKNELIGIFLCILVGFVFGLIICAIDYGFSDMKQLTPEMASRCEIHSIIVGIFIALVSGAAVAIAVLSENFGSLVGTAISASLLPPAVNTGLMWAYSCIHLAFKTAQSERFSRFVDTTKYSENQSIELLILGTISLCMTLTNVLCVFVVGKVLIRIKIEVAPVFSDEERQFWKHDVPIARDFNKTLHAEDGKKLSEELAEICERERDNFRGVGVELLRQEYTHTWSSFPHRFTNRYETTMKTSLTDFQALFKTFSGKIPSDDTDELNGSSGKHSEFINIYQPKRSDPIPTPKSSSSDHNFKFCSAPLDSIDRVQRRTTFVNIDTNSADDEKSPSTTTSYINGKRKFVVTPAVDPFV